MLVDTHCHLTDQRFDDDLMDVVSRARAVGVAHIIVVGDSAEATDRAIAVARSHGISAPAGVHPHVADSWCEEVAGAVRDALAADVVVAVGETGLDYHYEHSPRAAQRAAFRAQLALAVEHDLPVVVHAREADDDMAAALRDTSGKVVLHSFSSGEPVFEAGLDIGAYFSFSGMVTFKSWTGIEFVKACPSDRIMVETDAPYLAPVPHRGKRNEPAFVRDVAARIAELRGLSLQDVEEITTTNAARCFGERVAQQSRGS